MESSKEIIIYTIDQLPSDIIKIIHNQLDFIDQCNLRLVSAYFTMYEITNLLDNVPNVDRLTDAICQSYPMCTKLNATNNNKITNINHLVNLTELNTFNNDKITDFTHLINLRILYYGNDFEIFPIGHDDKIIDINHLKNLRILHCVGDCEIHNTSIVLLTNLTELNCTENPYITDINHLVNLKILYAKDYCEISNTGISTLTNLTELNCSGNKKITNINHLVNLKTLRAKNKCGIDNNGFKLLTNLTKLDSSDNRKILIGARYFNAFSETNDIIGKCSGQCPLQAASKMSSKITNNAKENGIEIDIDKPMIIRLKETTHLSFEKKYEFTCNRKKLHEPQQVTTYHKVTGEPKTTIYVYKNQIKRIKKIDK